MTERRVLQQRVFDTVAVIVQVPDHAEFADAYMRRYSDRRTGELTSRLMSSTATLAGGLPVKVLNVYRRRILRFESSVPRCLGRDPLQLVTADEVREFVAGVLEEALGLLNVEPLGEPHLSRVDVARQFVVPADLAVGGIAALGDVLGLTVFRDLKTGGTTASTLKKETSLRLYDKTAQLRLEGGAGPRIWRCEVQFRGRAARARGLSELGTLDGDVAIEAARRVSIRERIGTLVGCSTAEVRRALQAAVASGERNVEQLVGYALMRELDVPTTKHRSTTARYEQALADLALPSLTTTSGAALRLDWPSGRALRIEKNGGPSMDDAHDHDEVGGQGSRENTVSASHATTDLEGLCQEVGLDQGGIRP